jgi:hypothetical protein
MNKPNVISINPGQKTLGQLHQEAERYNPVVKQLVSTISSTVRLKACLNFFTGIDTKTMKGASARILLLRLFTSVLLASFAYAVMNPAVLAISDAVLVPALDSVQGNIALSTSIFVMAASILLGFMTRIVSVAAFPYFIPMVLQGTLPISIASALLFVALGYIILGPGIFSVDQCIRKTIFRNYKRRAGRRAMQARGPRRLRGHHDLDYRSYLRL